MMYPDVFVGGYGPEAFMAWADSLDSFIEKNQVSSRESLSFAVSLLKGESRAWWRGEEEARWSDEEPIYTWDELKIIMCYKYVPGFQLEEEESDSVFTLEETAQSESLQESSLPTVAAEQERETQELCLYVPDQTKQEEKVMGESSATFELAHVLVDQGDNFKTLTCDLLIRDMVCVQFSVMEHLRAVKGLQQVVFEPGGSLSVRSRSNTNLAQKTGSYQHDLQGFFTNAEQDLRSNLFEGREDGVILSSCCDKRGETGGNTFLIRSITDQNKQRRARQKLVVVKETPKFQNEYGDHYTRPPDPMQHEKQVMMSIGQDVLRDIRGILLSSQKGVLQTPDQQARFLLVFGDLILISYQGKHETHDEIPIVEACSWSKWREASAAVAGYELIQEKRLLSLSSVCSNILRHVRGLQHSVFKPGEEVCVCKDKNQGVSDRARKLEIIEQGSRSLLKHGKGLQSWIFDPGDDHGSIILQDLDLRTNPFEGREYGATLSMLKLKGWDAEYGIAKTQIKAWLNGQFQGLTGMIYEVLDREKDERFDTASGKHGMIKNLCGREEASWVMHKSRDKLFYTWFWHGKEKEKKPKNNQPVGLIYSCVIDFI